mgnify:FL=1
MTIYILHIYSLETDEEVDAIVGESMEEVEAAADDKWGSNDVYWSYSPAINQAESI